MRVTKTDGCGSPILGSESQVVSDGFISVALTANTDEGTTISVQNAAGKTCILDEPCPTFTGYSAEVQFCSVDPALFSLMAGQDPVLDPDGGTVGFRVNAGVDACGSGFALELWSQVPAGACEEGTGESFGYFLIPFMRGGVLGDFTVANDAINFTLTGATSRDGSTWGVGPYDVVDNGAGPLFEPGPLLEPIDAKDHLHMQLTSHEFPASGPAVWVPGRWDRCHGRYRRYPRHVHPGELDRARRPHRRRFGHRKPEHRLDGR